MIHNHSLIISSCSDGGTQRNQIYFERLGTPRFNINPLHKFVLFYLKHVNVIYHSQQLHIELYGQQQTEAQNLKIYFCNTDQ